MQATDPTPAERTPTLEIRPHLTDQLTGIGNGGGAGSELYAVYVKPQEARSILAALSRPAVPAAGAEALEALAILRDAQFIYENPVLSPADIAATLNRLIGKAIAALTAQEQ